MAFDRAATAEASPKSVKRRVYQRIDSIALDSRVIGQKPETSDVDTQWPEPEQATWVQITATSRRPDRAPCELQILRPRAWAEQYGLVAGATLPLDYPELKLTGSTTVHAVAPSPPIQSGKGNVVIGRFVTREIDNLARITLTDGTVIESTDNHPIWSVDRQAFVAVDQLQPGERLQSLDAELAVERVERVGYCPTVYNLEVHGQHVYHVAETSILVHNADYATTDKKPIQPAPGSAVARRAQPSHLPRRCRRMRRLSRSPSKKWLQKWPLLALQSDRLPRAPICTRGWAAISLMFRCRLSMGLGMPILGRLTSHKQATSGAGRPTPL
jgi:hypothetical protein